MVAPMLSPDNDSGGGSRLDIGAALNFTMEFGENAAIFSRFWIVARVLIGVIDSYEGRITTLEETMSGLGNQVDGYEGRVAAAEAQAADCPDDDPLREAKDREWALAQIPPPTNADGGPS